MSPTRRPWKTARFTMNSSGDGMTLRIRFALWLRRVADRRRDGDAPLKSKDNFHERAQLPDQSD
jgi:hypothetical protein